VSKKAQKIDFVEYRAEIKHPGGQSSSSLKMREKDFEAELHFGCRESNPELQ
jgi:hypothetical protein